MSRLGKSFAIFDPGSVLVAVGVLSARLSDFIRDVQIFIFFKLLNLLRNHSMGYIATYIGNVMT
jgi:hypothetical protein